MAKKKRRLFWYILLGLIVIIQFIPGKKPTVSNDNKDDLLKNNEVPATIANVLRNSCYDCHSNETKYPLYSRLSPIKYLVYHDIEEGREHLNFSTWQSMKKIDRATALDEISTVITTGEMPMKIYTIMHSEAKLDDRQKNEMTLWAELFAEKIFE